MSVNAIAIANRVLELNELDDFEGILNIATPPSGEKITKETSPNLMKKAYLKISLIIHPDKMGKFDQATRAFQALVRAYEVLSAPEYIDRSAELNKKGKKDKQKPLHISRSNEGCYRTSVCCPRCKVPWSENTLDGNPPYFYNFLMSGLKQYTCSTCLCEFGCMTGIHKCPFCKKQFDYSPQNYHNKITCSNKNCNKPFGFMLYAVSDRVMTDLFKTIKEELEKRIKAKEAKQRRAARSNRGNLNQHELEQSFLMGLTDCCPRCGEDFSETPDNDVISEHLLNCNDEIKHSKHKKNNETKEKKRLDKESKADAQESVLLHSSWQFLGSDNSQLWLLDDDHIRNIAKDRNIDSTGDKDEIISRIVRNDSNKSSNNMIENSNNNSSSMGNEKGSLALTLVNKNSNALVVSDSSQKKRKRKDLVESLPSNIYSMSVAKLRSVCASHDLLRYLNSKSTKSDIIEVIERELYGKEEITSKISSDENMIKLITNKSDSVELIVID
eukprot:gene13963-18729_t